MQREIISSLKKEKVAELIDKMTPGQAADVFPFCLSRSEGDDELDG